MTSIRKAMTQEELDKELGLNRLMPVEDFTESEMEDYRILYGTGEEPTAEQKRFNTHFNKVMDELFKSFLN